MYFAPTVQRPIYGKQWAGQLRFSILKIQGHVAKIIKNYKNLTLPDGRQVSFDFSFLRGYAISYVMAEAIGAVCSQMIAFGLRV
jgi:hypothetical protein